MGLDEGMLAAALVIVALTGVLFAGALVEARMTGRREGPRQGQ